MTSRDPSTEPRILLIFDCDGVLVDSELIAAASLAEFLSWLGRPTTPQEALMKFVGRSLDDVLALCEELSGRPVPPDAGLPFARRMYDRFRRELQPVNGIREALAALPYRRCVASSSVPERLNLALEVTRLAPLFGGNVFSRVEVARGKPAPDLFLFAARSLGEAPQNCIVIEDSVLGVRAAVAAEMAVIGFVGASHATDRLRDDLAAAGADVVIASMADLASAIGQLADQTQVGMNARPRGV
jgi:HAD superfamily hydrolase (TIGR01509 family)